ncbi:Fur family transcriptional regulator [Arcanobacterium sp. S3PF19]|uniref:Fur family transcriptional regulator n=1 Tax=Arcanobacterium sp. S3PF19 TaxID=1219585 RepID=UPI00050E8265|nr:Fur family transcriptional regulator [Arcanobacterium sp. S3PF19]KGF05437.1 Fur family transcriptional regulator [Arcanobacterium sp. S3PF19]
MQRMTRQRIAIIELLRNQQTFLSAQDIHDLLREGGVNIGLATVYRNLQAMYEDHTVDTIRQEGTDIQLFRYCAEDTHHHHLVCRCCGKTVDIKGGGFEQWARKIAAENDFSRVSHSFELYGQCSECINHESGHTLK